LSDSHYRPPIHGGDPRQLPAANSTLPMLDLATGINPWPWPLVNPPNDCYTTLPYFNAELQSAAASYYGVAPELILATAGSQPVIQQLPYIAPKGRVLLPAVGYEEHRYRWQRAGHDIVLFERYDREEIARQIATENILHMVLISPNNPSADQLAIEDLRYWRGLLPAQGLLVVDQAFADANPESDVSTLAGEPGIVLLRSVGKFFGLPGLRLGFVLAEPSLLAELDCCLGPWTVSGAAQWIGQQALLDKAWQRQTREKLFAASSAQAALLAKVFAGEDIRCVNSALFVTLIMPLAQAEALQSASYQVGLSVRVYHCGESGYMRWGLAADLTVLAERLSQLDIRALAA
jgi:cobalamin biosynthetic protein CobC